MSSMIGCGSCGASNLAGARLCSQCGRTFVYGGPPADGTMSGGNTFAGDTMSGGSTVVRSTGRTPLPPGYTTPVPPGTPPPRGTPPPHGAPPGPPYGTVPPPHGTPPGPPYGTVPPPRGTHPGPPPPPYGTAPPGIPHPGTTPPLTTPPTPRAPGDAPTRMPTDSPLLAPFGTGQVVEGKYELLDQLGRGGMGIVFRARHLLLGDEVAIKFMDPGLAASASIRERFFREARVLRSFRHRGAVSVHDAGEIRGTGVLYMVMDLAPGESLSDYLRREGPLPAGLAVELGAQILDVLSASHAKGIVHRDIKPKNVHVAPGPQGRPPRVYVLDFGIAKLLSDVAEQGDVQISQPGMVIGTPEYMSPEQAAGDAVDARSDLFSTAAVLYRMLSGQLPHRAKTRVRMIHAILTKEPPPLAGLRPELPPGLIAAVERGLRKDLEQRWQSAEQFASALRGGSVAPPPAGVTGVTGATGLTGPGPVTSSDRTILAPSEPLAVPAAPPSGGGWLGALLLLCAVLGAGALGWTFRAEIAAWFEPEAPPPPFLEVLAPRPGAVVGEETRLRVRSSARRLQALDRLSGEVWDMARGVEAFESDLRFTAEGARWLVLMEGTTALDSVRVIVDTTEPAISLFSPFDGEHTEAASVLLDGRADDPHLAEVTVNGERLDPVFARDFPLRAGENLLELVAVDEAGNKGTRSVRVVRQGGVEQGPPLAFELEAPSEARSATVAIVVRSSDARLRAVSFGGRSIDFSGGVVTLSWELEPGPNSTTLTLLADGLDDTERVLRCVYTPPALALRAVAVGATPFGFFLSGAVDEGEEAVIEVTWDGSTVTQLGASFEHEIWPRSAPSWLTVRAVRGEASAESSFVVSYQEGAKAWLPPQRANLLAEKGATVAVSGGEDGSVLHDDNALDGLSLRPPFQLELTLPEARDLLALRFDGSSPWSGTTRPAVVEVRDATSGRLLCVSLLEDQAISGALLPAGLNARRLRLVVVAGQRSNMPVWIGELGVLGTATETAPVTPVTPLVGLPDSGPVRDAVDWYELETFPQVRQVASQLFADGRVEIPEGWGWNLFESAEVTAYGENDGSQFLCDGNLLTNWTARGKPIVWSVRPVLPVTLERIVLVKGLLERARGPRSLYVFAREPDTERFVPLAELSNSVDRQVIGFELKREFRAAELLFIAHRVHGDGALTLCGLRGYGSAFPAEPLERELGRFAAAGALQLLEVQALQSSLPGEEDLLRLARRENDDGLLMRPEDAPVGFRLVLSKQEVVAGIGAQHVRRRALVPCEIEVYARVEGQEEWALQADLGVNRLAAIRFAAPVRTRELLVVFRRFGVPLQLKQLGVFSE